MQKLAGHISAILKGILFIGISVQIVMGIIWICRNFSHVPLFEESQFYMQVSRTLRCDEQTGILYPLFLWMVRRNHYVVYVIQLAVAYIAARRFLRVFLPRGKWKIVWGSLAFMTIPVVMQCHAAMLPCSLAASLLLLELSLLSEAVRRTEERTLRKFAELCLCWLALALLLPEYLYLGAVPAVLFSFCCWRQWGRHKRIRYYGFLLAAVFVGLIVGINSLTQTRGLYGRARKTPLTALAQRVAWPTIVNDCDAWIWYMPEYVSEEMILDAAVYADGMEHFIFPAIEQAVTDQSITWQQAEEYYVEMIRKVWKWHSPMIIRQMMWDMLGYGASPALLQIFLAGEGYDTYSNRNYDFFLESTPRLSRLYMDYGSWWFTAAAVLAAALQILRLCIGGLKGNKAAAETVLCCLIMAVAMILWYTMQGAGMQDYKDTALIDQLWMAWPVLLVGVGMPGQRSENVLRLRENGERDI